MTAHTIRRGGKLSMHVSCDHMRCDVRPTDDEIIAAGGLTKMGWERRFDESVHKYKHYCPAHRRTPAVSSREV